MEGCDADGVREGRPDAETMFVGAQLGDLEDREGRPFAEPAGLLLDEALAEGGLIAARLCDQCRQAFQV